MSTTDSTMAKTAPKLHMLEGLRFLLAVATMVWHYYYYGPLSGQVKQPAINNSALPFLCFSVEAFFIVSGLVITFSTDGKTARYFAKQRLLRLAPALFICSTLTFATYIILNTPSHRTSHLQSYLSSITVAPLAVVKQGIDDSLWSLKYEIRFYLIVFVLLFIINVKEKAFQFACTLLAIDALVLVFEMIGLGGPPY